MSVQPGSEVTQKAIRRVSQPVVFDLRHYEEASGAIRVLQSMDMRKKKAAVEFYSIATDDEEDDDGALSVKVVHEVPPDEWMEGGKEGEGLHHRGFRGRRLYLSRLHAEAGEEGSWHVTTSPGCPR